MSSKKCRNIGLFCYGFLWISTDLIIYYLLALMYDVGIKW